jgi:hypothetical protein
MVQHWYIIFSAPCIDPEVEQFSVSIRCFDPDQTCVGISILEKSINVRILEFG